MNIIAAQDQREAFLMFEPDIAAANALEDVQLAVSIARSKETAAYVISQDIFSKPEPHGIMLRKDDGPIKALADRVTAGLYGSPEIETIYKKSFQSPAPPSGLNCDYPMPVSLKTSLKNPSSSLGTDAYPSN